jgi:Cys-tRNA(Pro) deacylase
MTMPDIPVTTAIGALRAAQVPFVPHFYAYQEHGGTGVAAGALGIDEHAVIKTLVMQTETRMPLIILMHGDREVSTKQLARALGVKKVDPCDPVVVTRHTGYQVGGVSPFGTRTKLPVYVEEGIMSLPRIFLNGGKRGFLVEVAPDVLGTLLAATPVSVAIPV